MKIGIITYWQSNDNYGQQLQCWALQQYLKSQGHEPYLIRYDFANRKLPVNHLKRLIKLCLVYPVIKKLINRKKAISAKRIQDEIAVKNQQRNFASFQNEHIAKSDKLYHSLDELKANPPVADLYIAGSDQIWSQLLDIKENEVFFLNFGDSNQGRVSYAASFGMKQYPTELNVALKENLSRFDFVSVREKAGVNICKNVGLDARFVLDPTLLLDSDKYRSIDATKRTGDYIYIYSLNVKSASEMYFGEVSKYASQRGYKIVVTPASGCTYGIELFEGVEYDYATIPAWLSNIENAKLVVTTSFHGIVFCLLMHTPFVYIPLKGALSGMNNRITNLLSSIGLDRHIANNGDDVYRIAECCINWDDVDKRIEKLRQDSYEFLRVATRYGNN